MHPEEILRKLKSAGSRKYLSGMRRFGINPAKAYGVDIYTLKKMAKNIKRNHQLAAELWKSGIHEARILAGMVDEPEKVTESQMENWVRDFDSWDVCDQVCSYLFDKTPHAYLKAFQWSGREEEFVKRSGFVLMAALSVHDKKASNRNFEHFFPVIEREAHDGRNFVKKAVNWALRQIGKRNLSLNKKAICCAKRIAKQDSRPAHWIARDALRELQSEKVHVRLLSKQKSR